MLDTEHRGEQLCDEGRRGRRNVDVRGARARAAARCDRRKRRRETHERLADEVEVGVSPALREDDEVRERRALRGAQARSSPALQRHRRSVGAQCSSAAAARRRNAAPLTALLAHGPIRTDRRVRETRNAERVALKGAEDERVAHKVALQTRVARLKLRVTPDCAVLCPFVEKKRFQDTRAERC